MFMQHLTARGLIPSPCQHDAWAETGDPPDEWTSQMDRPPHAALRQQPDRSGAIDGLPSGHPAAGESRSDAPRPDTPPRDARQFPLIVHCHLRWDFVWQRPQQLFSRLSVDHPVLFMEDPVHGAHEPSLDISEPYPNVVRMLPRLPHGAAGDCDGEWRLLLPLIEDALATHPLLVDRFTQAVQWFYSPMAAPVLLGRSACAAPCTTAWTSWRTSASPRPPSPAASSS